MACKQCYKLVIISINFKDFGGRGLKLEGGKIPVCLPPLYATLISMTVLGDRQCPVSDYDELIEDFTAKSPQTVCQHLLLNCDTKNYPNLMYYGLSVIKQCSSGSDWSVTCMMNTVIRSIL